MRDRKLLRSMEPCGTRQKPGAATMTEMFVGAEYLAQLFHVGKKAWKSEAWAFQNGIETIAVLRETRQHVHATMERNRELRNRDEPKAE